MPGSAADRWSSWIDCCRQNAVAHPDLLTQLHGYRDRVLDRAQIQSGDDVLDIGCGDGLIAFGALERTGAEGTVIFSDISPELIAQCRARAQALGAMDRCRFLVMPADDLHDIGAASVDVVTTRSVLIYIDRKNRALSEFFRVLRPGGRVSIGEPINRCTLLQAPGRFRGYPIGPVEDIVDKLMSLWEREVQPRLVSMLDFDERDLVAMAEHAGFDAIHLDLQVDIRPTPVDSWSRFLRTAPNPLSPTLEEMMLAALSLAERERLTTYLKPLVESGNGTDRWAFAYLSATKALA